MYVSLFKIKNLAGLKEKYKPKFKKIYTDMEELHISGIPCILNRDHIVCSLGLSTHDHKFISNVIENTLKKDGYIIEEQNSFVV